MVDPKETTTLLGTHAFLSTTMSAFRIYDLSRIPALLPRYATTIEKTKAEGNSPTAPLKLNDYQLFTVGPPPIFVVERITQLRAVCV